MSSETSSFFTGVQNILIMFIKGFQQRYPHTYHILETEGAALAYECTKMFTKFEMAVNERGLNKLFQSEKPKKRRRFFSKGVEVQKEEEHHDMIFYEVLHKDEKKYNTKRFENLHDMEAFEKEAKEIEVADNINMLGLQLKLKETDQRFDIALHDVFFIEGNILFDKPMVQYFLNHIHKKSITSEKYEITYIDQDMNVQTITQDEYIIIRDGKVVFINNKKTV